MKKAYLLFAVLVFIFFALVFLVISSGSLFPNSSQPSIVDDSYHPETEQPEFENGEQVSLLIDKLPYSGTNFSLSYDYNDGSFYVYFNPANPAAGDAELDQFLKQNNVSGKSQIPGLQTSSIPVPTPAP